MRSPFFLEIKLHTMSVSYDQGIIKSPVTANPKDVPEISITDYIFDKLKSKNLTESSKPWMVIYHFYL